MSIVRVEKNRDFTTVANRPFRDRRMSFDARGLLAFLLTKPDDWEVDTDNLINESPNAKRDKILALLKELEVFGHLWRDRKTGEGGQWEWETIIYESSSLNPHFDPESVPPYPEIPATGDSKTRKKTTKTVRARPSSPEAGKPAMVGGSSRPGKAGMASDETGAKTSGAGDGSTDSPELDAPDLEMPGRANPVVLRKMGLEEILNEERTDEEILTFVESEPRLSRADSGRVAFRFWQIHLEHPQAIFNPKRQRAVDDRLREGYSLARIVNAIRGCKLTPHNMGENERHTKFDGFDLICRDGEHIERFEAKAAKIDQARRARALAQFNGQATGAHPAPAPSSAPNDEPLSETEIEKYAEDFHKATTTGKYNRAQIESMFRAAMPAEDWPKVWEAVDRRKSEGTRTEEESRRAATSRREHEGEEGSTWSSAGEVLAGKEEQGEKRDA